jgi:hypothetical protein
VATYIAHNQSRDIVTLMLSKAEANALMEVAGHAWDKGEPDLNPQSRSAAGRALDALHASTNTSARRAGYFDT